jgi:hypothetical protein
MTGFHRNKVLQQVADGFVDGGATSFVETGTHHATTASYMALRHPRLPIFTCEIDDQCLAISASVLRGRANVHLSRMSSEKFVGKLVSEGKLGDMPLFFLDAHWFDYWPLPDEVASIARLTRFAMLIDDFAVPGQGHFETSPGGGGTLGEHRTKEDTRGCDMGLISHLLPDGCDVFYPKYGKAEAFGSLNIPRLHLVGYVSVSKNVPVGFLEADPLHFRGALR